MLQAEDYRTDTREIATVKVSVTAYRIGERFHCSVANLDPGATIARAEAGSREEAERLALTIAKNRLMGTSTGPR